MFGYNKVTTRRSFEGQPKETLRITSLFPTLQGEGPYAGRSAIFIRLAGCNLQCSFCDTYFDKGDDLTFAEILEKLNASKVKDSLSVKGNPLIIITGGEPFLQPNLGDLLYLLSSHGYQTQVESNGQFWQQFPNVTHLVISPKINEHTGQFIKLHDGALLRANTLKFVISATMPGYTDVPDWAIAWAGTSNLMRRRRIYVSPMNTYIVNPVRLANDGTLEGRSTDERISFWTPGLLDHVQNEKNHKWAAEIAMKRNVTLTLQMHLYTNLP